MGNRIFVHINKSLGESAIVVKWQNTSSSANFKEKETPWNYGNVLRCEIVLKWDWRDKPILETGHQCLLFFPFVDHVSHRCWGFAFFLFFSFLFFSFLFLCWREWLIELLLYWVLWWEFD